MTEPRHNPCRKHGLGAEVDLLLVSLANRYTCMVFQVVSELLF